MAVTEECVRRSAGTGDVDKPPSFLAWLASQRAAGKRRTGSMDDLREYLSQVWGRR